MSSPVQLDGLVASGMLLPYRARSRLPAKRGCYLTKEVQAKLDDPASAINTLVGAGFIQAALTKWVTGGQIHNDGSKRQKPRFLKRLNPPPPEVWEIRITDPVVQARVFCRFIAPDTLIITGIHTRGFLGNRGSHGWATATNEAVSEWSKHFGASTPFTGATIHDYVTSNCDDFSI